MPNDAVTFAVDAEAQPELALAVRGLAAGLGELGRACEVLVDPWPEALAGRGTIIEVGDGDHLPERWRLDLNPRADLELIDPLGRASSLPFVMPPLDRPTSFPGSILFVGGEAGRRTRMMTKTFDALRRRGVIRLSVWRALPEEVLRQRYPGEVHTDLRAGELARLLGCVAALVEVSDEATVEGLLIAAIGRASGIPTVLHESVARERWDGSMIVSEWSGEAFAEAAIAAARVPRTDDDAAAIRKRAAERLAGALFS